VINLKSKNHQSQMNLVWKSSWVLMFVVLKIVGYD
jgi:hypothetical protein